MSSRIVSYGVLYLFMKFSDVIGTGRPKAVMLGFGAVVNSVHFDMGLGGETIVVMERAIYIVSRPQNADPELPDSVYAKLEKGIHPQLEGGNLIILDNIHYLEAPLDASMGIYNLNIHYSSKGRPRCRAVEFNTVTDRLKLQAYLQTLMKSEFSCETVPMELRRAILGPSITLILVSLATIGLTLLASSWRANPPGPPVGKTKQDELVRAVIFLGPMSFFVAGLVFVMVTLLWMYRRMKSRPMLEITRPIRNGNTNAASVQQLS